MQTDDLTVKVGEATTGDMGQKLLVSGSAIALRQWNEEPGDAEVKPARSSDYETLGYVIKGRAEITVEGKTITLEPGVSWVVPKGAKHSYKILETFQAVEATHPPARN
ncbi:MAG: cupin domain-containing protein [Phormidesmis sp.]